MTFRCTSRLRSICCETRCRRERVQNNSWRQHWRRSKPRISTKCKISACDTEISPRKAFEQFWISVRNPQMNNLNKCSPITNNLLPVHLSVNYEMTDATSVFSTIYDSEYCLVACIPCWSTDTEWQRNSSTHSSVNCRVSLLHASEFQFRVVSLWPKNIAAGVKLHGLVFKSNPSSNVQASEGEDTVETSELE